MRCYRSRMGADNFERNPGSVARTRTTVPALAFRAAPLFTTMVVRVDRAMRRPFSTTS